jgi:hypothetical protein
MGLSLKTTLNKAGEVRKSTSASKNAGVSTLLPEQFEQWDALVSLSPHGTVFHYSWWLRATGSDFRILGYWDDDGNLVGGIPLPYKKRAALTLYHSPQLTPYLGPIFDLTSVDKTADALLIMRDVGEQLAQAIRGYDSLIYTAGATAPDLQGFLWAGFHADLGYTFRIEAGTTVDQAFQQISRTHRQKLNKSAEYLIETADDVSVLSKISNQTFERQGIARPYSEDYLQCLWQEASRRNRGVIYTARDVHGTHAAALFIVYDYRSSYQIVSGVDMSVPNSPAGGLLTWRGICDALNAGRTFDFEGSGIRGVEQYYRRWGGQAHPVWHLKKTGSLRGSLAKLFLNLRRDAGANKKIPE